MASYRYHNGAASSSSAPFVSSKLRHQSFGDDSSVVEDCLATAKRAWMSLLVFWRTQGKQAVWAWFLQSVHQLRRNLTLNRVFSVPHVLVAVWVPVMLWGESWVFQTAVEKCAWDSWEKWPSEVTPHHLVFVADPQIIDPKSYPGRPWPISSLTVAVTDNYMRRSYTQLQGQLHPDTVIFLGDLFDGGREWATSRFDTPDLSWNPRPKEEVGYAKRWKRKYGEKFWLREYVRFVKMFVDPYFGNLVGGPGWRGNKFIASLPGNHDLGYGSGIKVPVRERFEAFFGAMNRVDVIANHTFVSVDTLSLSARTSEQRSAADLSQVYGPAEEFLGKVQLLKRKAVERELRRLRGQTPDLLQAHEVVDDLSTADYSKGPTLNPGEGTAELPTILLTHVPLYRPPGTPCGPLRERWPPANPPQEVDHRNAISVSRGYQYQNVLNEADSIDLVDKIGNLVHVFSGDDHDYCEITHKNKGNVKEITVKSISMAMGVPRPGFLMMSMYNPIDSEGKPLSTGGTPTLQTHLCLLPSQLATYARYAGLAFVCLVMLAIRAFLVPIFHLEPFALDPEQPRIMLPVFKAKRDDYDTHKHANGHVNGNGSSVSSFHATPNPSGTRDRSATLTPGIKPNGLAAQARNAPPKRPGGNMGRLVRHSSNKEKGRGSQFSWGEGPKIEIDLGDDEYYYDKGKSRWKASVVRRGGVLSRGNVRVVGRELWTTVWRVLWMVGLYWFWLTWKG